MGEFDYNVRIVAPQEWLHLQVPFGLADKDLSMAKLMYMYGYLDIMQVASNKQQGVMSTHLMTLMHLPHKYKWFSAPSFHYVVLDCFEARLASRA